MALGSGKGGGGLARVVRHQRRRHKPSGTASSTVPAGRKTRQVRITPKQSRRAGRAALRVQRRAASPPRVKPTPSGVGRTLAAQAPAVTGLSKKAERKASKALAPTRPSFTPSSIASAVEDVTGLRLPSKQEVIAQETGSGKTPSLAKQAEELGTAAALVAGPEVGRAGLRAAGEALKAVRGGEKAATEAERAATVARGEAKPGFGGEVKAEARTKGVKARARRAQARASKKVEKPLEAPKMRVKRIATKSSAPRSRAVRGYAAALAVAPTTGGHGPGQRLSALVKGHEQAIIHHPVDTLETTARVAEGIPLALAAIPAAGYTSIKHGTTKPIEGLVGQQADYLKEIGKLYSGNEKTVERTVSKKVGLVPAISAGLGGGAVASLAKHGVKALREAAPEEALKIDRKTRQLADTAEHGATPAIRRQALRDLEAKNREGARSTHSGRKRESERGGVRDHRYALHHHRESKVLFKPLRKVAKRPLVPGHVAEGDIIQYLTRRAFGPETKDIIGKVRRDRASLRESSRALPADELHTRTILDAIIAHPEVLKEPRIWRAVEANRKVQGGRAIERHELHTGKPETTPLPQDERSRFLSLQRAEGILTEAERIPPELRHKVKLTERAGHNAEKVIRGNAKNLQRKARNLRRTAKELEKTRPERAATLHERADTYEARAAEHLNVTDRFRNAEKLDYIAAKVDGGQRLTKNEMALAENFGGSASELRKSAEGLREAGRVSQETRHQETMMETRSRMAAEGYAEPAYVKQTDVTRAVRPENQPNVVPRGATKKERFKSGALEAQGRIDESLDALLTNLEVGRRQLAADRSARDAIIENAPVVQGSRFLSDHEQSMMRRGGKIPRGYVPVDLKEFSGVIQRNAELRKDYEAARKRAATAPKGERTVKMLWKKSNLEQFESQLKRVAGPGKAVRAAFRIQTGAMLGTSPTWFLFQIPATPLAVLARNWSPARYGRVTRQMVDIYRNASKRQRAELNAHWGGGVGNLLEVGDIHTDIRPDTIRGMADSMKMVRRSPLGRFVRGLGTNLSHGGPLIRMNRAYEARIRQFAAMMEMDRQAGLTARGTPTISASVVRYIDKTGRLANSIYPLLNKMEGMKPHERIAWINNHPKEMRLVENGLNDALGEWASMTKFEQGLSSVFVFYPFLRFSLRWLFYAYPKNNPLKAAVLMNLAQSNDIELQKILGHKPDLFQLFGGVVVYDAEGVPHPALNLSRSAPGGNAVVEALGSGKIDLSTILKPVQPIVASGALALEHKNAFGEPTHGTSSGELFARSIVGLSPLTRGYAKDIGPKQSEIAKLFQAIQGNPNPLLPQVVIDLRRQADVAKLQHLLGVAYGDPVDLTSLKQVPDFIDQLPGRSQDEKFAAGRQIVRQKDRAWKQIDQMEYAYGVSSPKKQKKATKRYIKVHKAYENQHGLFGTEPRRKSSSGGLGGGGLSGGGLGGGGL